MNRSTLSLLSLVLLSASAPAAAAQILRNESIVLQRMPQVQVVASTTFRAYDLTGSLEGAPITLSLGGVSIAVPWRWVLLNGVNSVINVTAPQGVPNGTYSVRFTVPHTSAAGQLNVLRGGTVIAQCAVQQQLSYASNAPVQHCDSGTFSVTDGKLQLQLMPAQNPPPQPSLQADIDSVTVSRWG